MTNLDRWYDELENLSVPTALGQPVPEGSERCYWRVTPGGTWRTPRTTEQEEAR